ncbi:hypothetical protein H6G89_01475 [Oscillatoria sp. FACHB-1407]|uniref:DUF6817 domain-containing protein n=1 Tax=Oscillatoria sp. FACHB-1407 TaxID=2692847 RepID=UPI0016869F02|nr:hypothetical protein [Oscillatoria sp. FACHB-1407]MBD2459701.1 hypothetical protein [Oscillatoria sp. FACHB-1407]
MIDSQTSKEVHFPTSQLSKKYAQTNIQLFNQLCASGYSEDALKSIMNSYRLALDLFSGWFRPSGKTFISHLIGTASILGSMNMPTSVVSAGLLHAIYTHGNLGSFYKGRVPKLVRKKIVNLVGVETEEYIFSFTNLKKATLTHKNIDILNSMERNTLVIRLANELEERLDFGLLHCGKDKQEKYSHVFHISLVNIAVNLGYPNLAAELDIAFKENNSLNFPQGLYDENNQSASYFVSPYKVQGYSLQFIRKIKVLSFKLFSVFSS